MGNIEVGKVVDFVHFLVESTVNEKNNLFLIDCTAGNGYDTLKLCKIAEERGKVLSLDIQKKAIERTEELLKNNLNYINYEIINDSHENIDKYFNNKLDIAIFNLGYLPYSDKNLKTKPETTIRALEKLLPMLKENGKIFITTYIKHDSGHERDEIRNYLMNLNKQLFNVINFKIINKDNSPPEIFIIERNA